MSTQESDSSESWINPYIRILDTFPGRLFTFADEAGDTQKVLSTLSNYDSVICEFGSGSGKHAIELARGHPTAAVLGFELRFKRSVKTIEKAKKAGVENLFVLRTKAERFSEIVPKKSLNSVYVNFPDPWAKKRQRKHRLLSEAFFANLSLYLKADGAFYFKTDHREYFNSVTAILENSSQFRIDDFTHDLYSSPYLEGSIDTEFENLFFHQGLPINYLRASLT